MNFVASTINISCSFKITMNTIKLKNDQKFNQIESSHERLKRQNHIQTQKIVCYQNQALTIRSKRVLFIICRSAASKTSVPCYVTINCKRIKNCKLKENKNSKKRSTLLVQIDKIQFIKCGVNKTKSYDARSN